MFYLPFSPPELATKAQNARWRGQRAEGTLQDVEMVMIAGMVREVAAHAPASDDVTVRSGYLIDFPPAEDDGKVHWYSCINVTPEGNCGIYALRPRMCSEYPYGKPCLFAGCQSGSARTGTMGKRLRNWPLIDPDKVATFVEEPQAWR